MNIIILIVFCVLLSAVLTQLYYRAAVNTRLVDIPNERSLHSTPKVRGGGLVFIGISLCSLPLLALIYPSNFDIIILLISITLLATINFLDDLFNLPAKPRFLIQFLVAILIVYSMSPITLNFVVFSVANPVLVTCFLVFAIIGAINHFNFMDGLDGFCAAQAIFLFTTYAVLFHLEHALFYEAFCLILISSLIGFLIFNFPPAKLFMGDIGSATLGFISFYLALIAQQKFQIPLLYWFLFNALFLFDSTVTLVRRIINKEKWSTAHRKHAYQRLNRSGVSPRTILLGQLGINTLLFSLGFLFYYNNLSATLMLFIPLGLLFFIYLRIETNFPMFQ
jgi:UDP-N-acetylmuramyl pentapeptide phosphotransferase/UDP-N-acetylglucosamine-1-phosphate transferase